MVLDACVDDVRKFILNVISVTFQVWCMADQRDCWLPLLSFPEEDLWQQWIQIHDSNGKVLISVCCNQAKPYVRRNWKALMFLGSGLQKRQSRCSWKLSLDFVLKRPPIFNNIWVPTLSPTVGFDVVLFYSITWFICYKCNKHHTFRMYWILIGSWSEI